MPAGNPWAYMRPNQNQGPVISDDDLEQILTGRKREDPEKESMAKLDATIERGKAASKVKTVIKNLEDLVELAKQKQGESNG